MSVSIARDGEKVTISMPPARNPLVLAMAAPVLVGSLFILGQIATRSIVAALVLSVVILASAAPYLARVIWEVLGVESVVLDDTAIEVVCAVSGHVIKRSRYNLFEASSIMWRPALAWWYGELMARWNLGNAWSYGHRVVFVYHDRAASFGWNLEADEAQRVVDAIVEHDQRIRQHYGLPPDKGLGAQDSKRLEHAVFETQQEEPLPWTRRGPL